VYPFPEPSVDPFPDRLDTPIPGHHEWPGSRAAAILCRPPFCRRRKRLQSDNFSCPWLDDTPFAWDGVLGLFQARGCAASCREARFPFGFSREKGRLSSGALGFVL